MKFFLAIIVINIGLSSCIPANKRASTEQTLGNGIACSVQVGVRTREFEYNAAPETIGRQRECNWCAPASVQMILNYHNVDIKQEDIVRLTLGELRNEGVSFQKLAAALNGRKVKVFDRDAQLEVKSKRFDSREVLEALEQRKPILVGLLNLAPLSGGHAQVLTAASFHTLPFARTKMIDYVTLRDPWGPAPSKQVLTYGEFLDRRPDLLYIDVVFP